MANEKLSVCDLQGKENKEYVKRPLLESFASPLFSFHVYRFSYSILLRFQSKQIV